MSESKECIPYAAFVLPLISGSLLHRLKWFFIGPLMVVVSFQDFVVQCCMSLFSSILFGLLVFRWGQGGVVYLFIYFFFIYLFIYFFFRGGGPSRPRLRK